MMAAQHPMLSFVGGPYNGTSQPLGMREVEMIEHQRPSTVLFAGRLYMPIGVVTGTFRIVVMYLGKADDV